MTVRLRLFASIKEETGRDQLTLELPDDARASDVMAAVAAMFPGTARLLPTARIAIDQAFVSADHPVPPGAEVAIIPPVSGG